MRKRPADVAALQVGGDVLPRFPNHLNRDDTMFGASVWRTQRWRNGQPRWRWVGEPGFDPDRYGVRSIAKATAEAFCVEHHYAKSCPPTKYCFGLYDLQPDRAPTLVGVAALGIPMSDRVLTRPFPTLVPRQESLELSRLVLLGDVPANGESWFCARTFRLAAENGVRGVLTFADPEERWADGPNGPTLIKPGHVGIVYQALNFDYLGRGTARTLTVLPDHTVLNARSRAKVTGGERGADRVVERLVMLGARPPRTGEDPARWLGAALDGIGAHRRRHPGNHRYALRLGRNRGERTRTTIGMTSGLYPKLIPGTSTQPRE